MQGITLNRFMQHITGRLDELKDLLQVLDTALQAPASYLAERLRDKLAQAR